MNAPAAKRLAALAAMIVLMQAQGAGAQKVDCPKSPPDFVRIPELVARDGKLRGTIVVSAEQQRIAFRVPATAPDPHSTAQCFPQWVRTMRGVDAVPPPPSPEPGAYPDPLPAPTLRARVGDLVQITFLNQIDPGKFPYSIDRGEEGGCDTTSTYPGTDPQGDKYPDCFHGSSTANIHFHGTHTNPGSTGDNVFVEVRPSLRTQDQANRPLVTRDSVRKPFDEFFALCEAELKPTDVLRQWPRTWNDLPREWTDEQKRLLKLYDQSTGSTPRKKLWPVDERQLERGLWPQYYIGAYPYCFRLPAYTESTWPPGPVDVAHTHGAGTAEQEEPDPGRPLIMGQAPGTHWYHAHKHGSTAINVANGMTGVFVIEGKYDDDLNAYYGAGWTRKQPVMVINQIGVAPNLLRGGGGKGQGQDKGPDFSVNGRLKPVLRMYPGQVQMWRIANTSGRAGAFFAAPPQLRAPAPGSPAAAPSPPAFQWRQLAQDGVQLVDENYQNSLNRALLLAPGNRADLLVKAPTAAGPYDLLVQNAVDPSDLASAKQVVLLSVVVGGTGPAMDFVPRAPSFPPFLADIAASEVKGTKTLVFGSTPPTSPAQPAMHTIDGRKFGGEVGAVVLLNTVEEWKVVNQTYGPQIAHPFHIHINPFQIVEVFDPNAKLPGTTLDKYVFNRDDVKAPGQCFLDLQGNPDDWKPCDTPAVQNNLVWWDVFPIPSGRQVAVGNQSVNIPGYFKMRSRFVDYSGYYVLHCHILAHEDRGMMTVVQVAPMRSPYSHH